MGLQVRRVGATADALAEGEASLARAAEVDTAQHARLGVLLRWSRRLVADADSLTERARALKGGETGMLRVGVDVHLVEDGGASLCGRLERGDVQLAIKLMGDARFHERVLFPAYGLAVVASPPPRPSSERS
jgi:hypothetical protein